MNKTAQKNRRRFEEALYLLLKAKPPGMITISMICEQAKLSRTTFSHYYTKLDDILLCAYESAHQKAFGKEKWTLEYYQSDRFIHDMVLFFDQNSNLILLLQRWNLLAQIAYLPTQKSYFFSSRIDDPLLSQYPEYTTIYL